MSAGDVWVGGQSLCVLTFSPHRETNTIIQCDYSSKKERKKEMQICKRDSRSLILNSNKSAVYDLDSVLLNQKFTPKWSLSLFTHRHDFLWNGRLFMNLFKPLFQLIAYWLSHIGLCYIKLNEYIPTAGIRLDYGQKHINWK